MSLVAALSSVSAAAVAAPVDVSFAVSGSAGDWVYDFTVTNNLGGTNDIYFFGVQTGQTNITGSPAGWGYAPWDNPWNNAYLGGSSTTYDNPWCCASAARISPGQTLSGFQVTSNAATALTAIPWFAFAIGDSYSGPHFSYDSNPGFEGVAGGGSAAPEPASWLLMMGGFGAIGGAMRARQKASVSFA